EEVTSMRILKGTTARAIWSVGFSPDGRQLLSSGNDNAARLWDLATGTNRVLLTDMYLRGATLAPDGTTMVYQSSHRIARIALEDGTVAWQIRLGPMSTARGLRFTIRFSPDGQLIATGGDGFTLRDPRTGLIPTLGEHVKGSPVGVSDGIAFSPDGRTLAE